VLLVNPNTSPEITELMAGEGRRLAPGAEIRPVTGRFGARYIASRAAAAIAGHAALEAVAEHGAACDAVYLACFGDPGLLALKEIAPVPVVGMAEASCHLACLLGRRFGIVTGGERWGFMLGEFVASLGLSERLAGIRTVAPTGGEIAHDPEGALARLGEAAASCAAEDGAEVMVLGGAGLAGLARRLAPSLPFPVLCSFEAGLRAALAAAELHPAKAGRGSLAAPPSVPSCGLSPALEGMLSSSPAQEAPGRSIPEASDLPRDAGRAVPC
jgi:allantoin racemase